MFIKSKIEDIRKDKFGLNKEDTNLIFDTIMNVYKTKIIDCSKEIIGYTLDIVIANFNGYNRLGNINEIYKIWGDKFYVDLNNSTFCKDQVNEDGDLEFNENPEEFSKIKELEKLKNISFSLSNFISLCKENNINIKIFAKDNLDTVTTIELKPYMKFNSQEKSTFDYINSLE